MPKEPSPAQRAASRRNGSLSRGPITDSGKEKSRRNACKHGLTGAGIAVMPEEQEGIDARLADFDADLKPRGALEQALVQRMALATIRLERAAEQEAAVLSLKCREAPGAWDRKVQDRVQALGKLLLDDPVPRVSSRFILDRDDPKYVQWRIHEPVVLVMELKETLQGCDYLIERWKELRWMLENEGYWHFDAKFKAIRMLGKRPEAVLYDLRIGEIFAACAMLHPEQSGERLVEDCVQAGYTAEARPMYIKRIDKLAERTPETHLAGIDFLLAIVDEQLFELELLREHRVSLAELNRSEAPTRAAFDDSKEGELRRRYEGSNSRDLHRCVADLLKLREAAEARDSDRDDDDEAGPPDLGTEPEVLPSQAPASNPFGPVLRVAKRTRATSPP